MKTLNEYTIDEIITILQEFRYRSENDPDIQEEIDSVLELLEEKDDE